MLILERRKGQSVVADGGVRITVDKVGVNLENHKRFAYLEFRVPGEAVRTASLVKDESVQVTPEIILTVTSFDNWRGMHSVKLGFDAPDDVIIHRQEIHDRLIERCEDGEETDRRPCTGFVSSPLHRIRNGGVTKTFYKE